MMEKIFEFGKEYFNNGLIFFVFNFFISLLLGRILIRFLLRIIDKAAEKQGKENTLVVTLSKKVIRIVIIVVIIIVTLYNIKPFQSLGNALLGLSSVVAVIASLGSQELASTLLAGAVLSAYEPYQKGDIISLPQHNISGTVVDMSFRDTTLLTPANTKVILPNNLITSSIIENKKYKGADSYGNDLSFTIAYDADFEQAKALLKQFINEHPLIIRKEKSFVIISELKDSSIELKCRFYTANPGDGFQVKGEFNEYVLKSFAREGIEIPYPYLNVIRKD